MDNEIKKFLYDIQVSVESIENYPDAIVRHLPILKVEVNKLIE